MGLITSRFNLDSLQSNGRRRSRQGEEQLYSYSLNKSYFSNYFFMGGERFEVNDPDYLFGDSCDLNFLTCTKPYALPYKKAQQNLLTNLNTKHKAINKVSSRVGSLSSPLNILTGRHRQVSQSHKQDAQTQTINNNKTIANGPEPSQPLIMLINIRKETLRLVKSSHACNLDSFQNSLTNTASISNTNSEQSAHPPSHSQRNHHTSTNRHHQGRVQKANSINRRSTTSSHATTVHAQDMGDGPSCEDIELEQTVYRLKNYHDSDTSSVTSNTYSSSQSTAASSSTGKSGYTSVRDVPLSDCASDEGEYFEDALNEPTNLSTDNDSEKNQQKSLLRATESTKETCDIKITIEEDDVADRRSACDIEHDTRTGGMRDKGEPGNNSDGSILKTTSINILTKTRKRKSALKTSADKKVSSADQQTSNRVYNIEFTFDAEVDCSIRVSYFCTRVVSSNDVTYKPLHATYKSKTYVYKRGLNQKFEQQEHSFRPYLFDEDLLIYKPLDLDGNYNSGAVFPIVIHCVALEGPTPRQSQSLVATVEKSQLDDSYSIKPLKQMIFVDGVQYILQDIYGIENKPLTSTHATPHRTSRPHRNLNSSCRSLNFSTNLQNSHTNLSETASIGSVPDGGGNGTSSIDLRDRGSIISNQYKSLASENTFECVICMSEERDTMLLPCRHMCLCSSCAQSLRYQSSSCPICRCPFKAALNLRFMRRSSNRKWSSNTIDETEHKCLTSATTDTAAAAKSSSNSKCEQESTSTRRVSLTNSATPLLARPKFTDSERDKKIHDLPDNATIPAEQMHAARTGIESIELHATTTSDKASESGSLEMKVVGKNSRSLGGGEGGGVGADEEGGATSATPLRQAGVSTEDNVKRAT